MEDWPVAPGLLRQPDRRSCGAAVLVAARVLADPAYAATLDSRARARDQILATHAGATGSTGPSGRIQVPWPRALGTPPWAVAAGLAAITGVAHRSRVVRWPGGTAYDLLVDAVSEHPAALYVGSRWLPRHVVLVVGVARGRSGGLEVFEPNRGAVVTVERRRFAEGLDLAGWDRPWFVVSARRAARRTPA